MKVFLVAAAIMDDIDGQVIPIGMDAVRECPAYGIYLLRAVLAKHGHEVVLADLIADATESVAGYADTIAAADLVGIGATSMSWPTAVRVIAQVRARNPRVPIVLGGIHATMFDEYILRRFDVQFVVRGEGEAALPALCDALTARSGVADVPNLTWKSSDGAIVRNPAAALLSRDYLAADALPDYSTVPAGVFQGLAIESARGCSFDCSFCSTSYRRTWRALAPEAFADRLERVMAEQGRTIAGVIHVVDDEFALNPRRAIAICEELARRGHTPPLVYDVRATDLCFDGLVPALEPFTHSLLVGAECGYDEGLARIGKGTTTAILEQAAATMAAHGMAERADFSFIMGLPWETRREVERTIDFAGHLFASYGVRVLLQWYWQIPGSRLWEEARRREVVHESMYDRYGFFRDLYLFRSAVQLTPTEIFAVTDKIEQMVTIARLTCLEPPRMKFLEGKLIEHKLPDPIRLNYDRRTLSPDDGALSRLREVAKPKRREAVLLPVIPIDRPRSEGHERRET
jgi:anaerobic magnesium-protoporphyrin IX monomethyl ester cyclase